MATEPATPNTTRELSSETVADVREVLGEFTDGDTDLDEYSLDEQVRELLAITNDLLGATAEWREAYIEERETRMALQNAINGRQPSYQEAVREQHHESMAGSEDERPEDLAEHVEEDNDDESGDE